MIEKAEMSKGTNNLFIHTVYSLEKKDKEMAKIGGHGMREAGKGMYQNSEN